MLPSYFLFHYNNYTIYYLNGVYKIRELPAFGFLSSTEAMREIDKEEKNKEFFDNLKQANDQTKKIIL